MRSKNSGGKRGGSQKISKKLTNPLDKSRGGYNRLAEFFQRNLLFLRSGLMKKFAKISAVLAAMALAFSFAGCSDGSSGGGSDSSEITGGGTSGGETSGGETSGGETSGGETSGGSGEISKDFVKIPAVSITGSESWTPESEVFVSKRRLEIKSFWMSDHEVTQAEWKDVMGSTPSYMANVDGNADNNPVNEVSWYDALVYCNKRSIKEKLTPCYTIKDSTDPDKWGKVPTKSDDTWNAVTCDWKANGYRLPTDAEWEWAARGGENYKYAGSDDIDDVAWYAKYEYEYDTGTREVKRKKPNGYVLYDMSGNVWEWCWDWWRENIPSDTPAEGVPSGSLRSLRGGSWCNYDNICSVDSRGIKAPSEGGNITGFRVVRSCD